ncbi:ComEC/Rec2 family competence protein [Holdemania massiliensis]
MRKTTRRRSVQRSKKRTPLTWGSLIGAILLAGLGYFSPQLLPESASPFKNTPSPVHTQVNSALTVHFIDVGQADAILIQSGEEAMMIDAGNNADAKLITDYLQQQGVTHLKYAIGTHAHEDHIGSLDAVLYSFDVDTVMLPKRTLESKSYKDVIQAIETTQTALIHPQPGDTFSLGEDQFVVLGPLSEDYSEVNNSSLVLRYVHGQTSILFTGDMQAKSEKDILDSYAPVQANILKAPHHGSDTSSTQAFLEAVKPQDVIISVGLNNDYQLPSEDVLKRYEKLGFSVYRTDQLGTILIESDGVHYTIHN